MSTLQDLRALVDRPGGDPALRCLALLHGAAVIGRFDAVDALAHLALERGVGFDRLEAAALQVVAYGGYPRAIETLGRLAALRAGPAAGSAVDGRDAQALAAAGRATFEKVYGEHSRTVLEQLDQLVPGFADQVLTGAYGRILSTGPLTLGERELLAVAALALAGLPRPLGSHIRGALRNGFDSAAVEDILHACSALAPDRASPVLEQALDRLSRKVYRP